MPMYRFMGLLNSFSKFPPIAEVLRTQVLLPGDKGYRKVDRQQADQAVRAAIQDAGKEPEWMRNARIKREWMKENVPHGR